MIDCSKCIHYEVCANRYVNDGCEGVCGYYLQDTYKEKYEELKEAYKLLSDAYEHEVTKDSNT